MKWRLTTLRPAIGAERPPGIPSPPDCVTIDTRARPTRLGGVRAKTSRARADYLPRPDVLCYEPFMMEQKICPKQNKSFPGENETSSRLGMGCAVRSSFQARAVRLRGTYPIFVFFQRETISISFQLSVRTCCRPGRAFGARSTASLRTCGRAVGKEHRAVCSPRPLLGVRLRWCWRPDCR